VLVPTLGAFDDPAAAALVRRQLRIIATTTGLIRHRSLIAMAGALADVIERTGASGTAAPLLVADALVATAYTALLWWATSDTAETPVHVLRETLAALGDAAGAAADGA
jgi:hypothetical protein